MTGDADAPDDVDVAWVVGLANPAGGTFIFDTEAQAESYIDDVERPSAAVKAEVVGDGEEPVTRGVDGAVTSFSTDVSDVHRYQHVEAHLCKGCHETFEAGDDLVAVTDGYMTRDGAFNTNDMLFWHGECFPGVPAGGGGGDGEKTVLREYTTGTGEVKRAVTGPHPVEAAYTGETADIATGLCVYEERKTAAGWVFDDELGWVSEGTDGESE